MGERNGHPNREIRLNAKKGKKKKCVFKQFENVK